MVKEESNSSGSDTEIYKEKNGENTRKREKIPLGVKPPSIPGRGRGRNCRSDIAGSADDRTGLSNESVPSTAGSDRSSNLASENKSDQYSDLRQSDGDASTIGNSNTQLQSAGFSRISDNTQATLTKEIIDHEDEKHELIDFGECYERYYGKDREVPAGTTKQTFPIQNIQLEILEQLEKRQCIVIKGETGSGKTTQVPLFILDQCAAQNKPCNIWVTQPRRMAAITIADHVANSRQWKSPEGTMVGKLIGYQVGLDRCMSEDTRILYMTAGIAANKMIGDRNLKNITHLIIGL